MKTLVLNHGRPAHAQTSLARLLLLIGGAAAVATGIAWQQLDEQQRKLEQDLQQWQQPRRNTSSLSLSGKENAAKRDEIAAVKTVMAELALPWRPLFKTLEGLNTPEVKLLAIEPNARLRKIRITAEAMDVEGMLSYVQKLAAQPVLQDVFLLTHERSEGSPMPVHFVVEAAWVQ
ncbi:hypothetical protein [Methylovorus sp. MP688]|uniref:hypothetical protein n=1 Tax=Methylovorus sp. (strain MP688) TaxID=887061 RepID=UPI0001EC4546|nr:hypothetical protein [Methylovorus sp. MP688]ADQ84051.1 conserved hypothetical protein [Methylovorus sp. MP688]